MNSVTALQRTCLKKPGAPLPRRGGAITVWLILAMTVVVTLLFVVAEVGNLWLARTELSDSLESAALAAVKEWGDAGGGSTLVPRQVGNAYAMANTLNGAPVDLTVIDPLLNRDPAEPCNENACGDGVLVFGAIINDNPEFVFDCCATPSCGCGGIRINAFKDNSGAATFGRQIGIFYEDGTPGVTICSVSFRLPQNPVRPPNQQPYWDLNSGDTPGRSPFISDFDASDSLNLNNTTPTAYGLFPGESTLDIRGMDPDPVIAGGNPQASDYRAPGNLPPMGLFPNSNGDVVFTFQDPVPGFTDRFQVMTIHFRPGTFQPPTDPMDPDTFEFIRFGASMNQLGPPAFPPGGNNNDGDKMGIEGVEIIVRLCNGEVCEGEFVDDGVNNDFSPSTLAGGSGVGRAYAVRAHASYEVPSLACELFGIPVGPFEVTACADALYDCSSRTPRLYLLEDRNFSCGVTCP